MKKDIKMIEFITIDMFDVDKKICFQEGRKVFVDVRKIFVNYEEGNDLKGVNLLMLNERG